MKKKRTTFDTKTVVLALGLSLWAGFTLFSEKWLQTRILGSQAFTSNVLAESDHRFGQIRGLVRIASRIPSKSMAISIYSRRVGTTSVESKLPEDNELENVVVYLEAASHSHPSSLVPSGGNEFKSSRGSLARAGQPNAVMKQIQETFVPHVLPILAGTSVDFPNEDLIFHNVFSLSAPKSFDLGRYPNGQKRTVRFDKPGIVKVFCHIHSHMSAVILVFAQPYFTVPDRKGEYLLSSVPVGEYALVAWHERLKPVRRSIIVKPGEVLVVDITL